jgi:hypothetical protein
MRGHAGALIDKAFCLKEAGFKQQARASRPFARNLRFQWLARRSKSSPR